MKAEVFGRYLLLERLAQGGMAEVFRAIHQGTAGFEKLVALKRILPVFAGSREFVDRFVDEARIAATLTHVNVAQVFDFGEIDGSYYLTMELVEGVDLGRLRDAVARRGTRLPLPLAAFVCAEAARGLAYAHEKRGSDGSPLGIVHRDVSPQNLLVSYAGEVKVADFGIAKAAGKLHRTESGAVLGKLRYMSPEQVTGEPLDGRSDLFSLGVVLWELIVGAPLFNGEHPGQVADQVKAARIDPPSRRVRDVPPELDRVVMKALERSRDARHGRAAELARALGAFVAQVAPAFGREDVGAFVQEVAPRPLDAEALESAAQRLGTDATVPARLSELRPPARAAATTVASPFAKGTNEDEASSTAMDNPPRRRLGGIVGGVLAVAALGGAAALVLGGARPTTAPPPPRPSEDAAAPRALDAALAPVTRAPVTPAERQRLQAELDGCPQAAATERGVPAADYLAILTAVDGALCLGSGGDGEPRFGDAARVRLEEHRLVPEARALTRYLVRTGELPPRVGTALAAFLRAQPSFSPGERGFGAAHLAALLAPGEARWRGDVIRENGATAGWHDGTPGLPFPELCERAAAVAALARLEPAGRAAVLGRYLAAAPLDQAVSADGLRWQLESGERDEAAATLTLRLRVTNPGAAEQPLGLERLRLTGLEAAPSVDPPADRLGGGRVRELRLGFSGVTDAVAAAAVLVVRPGAELQAYSEDLR